MFHVLFVLALIFSFEGSYGSTLFCPAGTEMRNMSSGFLEFAASSACKNVHKVLEGEIGQMKCEANQGNLFLLDPEPCSNFILLEMCFRMRHVKEIRATFGGFFEFEKTFRLQTPKIGDPNAWNWICLDTIDISDANNPLGDNIWNILINFRLADGFDKFAVQNLRITGCQFFLEDCDSYYGY